MIFVFIYCLLTVRRASQTTCTSLFRTSATYLGKSFINFSTVFLSGYRSLLKLYSYYYVFVSLNTFQWGFIKVSLLSTVPTCSVLTCLSLNHSTPEIPWRNLFFRGGLSWLGKWSCFSRLCLLLLYIYYVFLRYLMLLWCTIHPSCNFLDISPISYCERISQHLREMHNCFFSI